MEAKRKPIRTEKEVNDVDPQKGRVLLLQSGRLIQTSSKERAGLTLVPLRLSAIGLFFALYRPVSGASFLTNLFVLAACFPIL